MNIDKGVSGTEIANKIKEVLKDKVSKLNKGIVFSIIYVGQDSVIDNFIKYKKKFGDDVGVSVIIYNFDKNIKQDFLAKEIKEISGESDAVIVQLPLPEGINAQEILDIIPEAKDVDVLSTESKKSFANGENKMFPPVVGSFIEVLKYKKYNLFGKNIAIVGFGDLVGKPFSTWLEMQNFEYSIIEKETDVSKKNNILLNADVIISGVGIIDFIIPKMIKKGVVLLDAGTSETNKGLAGDISSLCYEKSSFYTPVPGGIGPLTIAILYQNILKTQLG